MKISPRFPSSINTEAPEQSVIQTQVGADKVPRRGNPTTPDNTQAYEDLLTNGAASIQATLGRFRNGSSDSTEESKDSQPLIASLLEKYKAPYSINQPKIESQVDKYKGPKSVRGQVVVETRVEIDKAPRRGNSTGPDNTQAYEDLLTNRGASIQAALGGFRNGSSDDSQSSQISSKTEKYKGPDSIQRAEIESKVDKYKGPKSL